MARRRRREVAEPVEPPLLEAGRPAEAEGAAAAAVESSSSSSGSEFEDAASAAAGEPMEMSADTEPHEKSARPLDEAEGEASPEKAAMISRKKHRRPYWSPSPASPQACAIQDEWRHCHYRGQPRARPSNV